jgi:transitional endoplasmic reticulum ATPase
VNLSILLKKIEPARKSSSKKKKKKSKPESSQAVSKAATPATTAKKAATNAAPMNAKKVDSSEKKDNSKAILNVAKGRNSMHVFLYDAEDGHTVVGMTESAMEDMGIFDGDTVAIKGKRGKKTVATVAMIPDTDVSALDASVVKATKDGTYCGAIGMTHDAMKNAGVRAGDAVTVAPAPDVKFGKAVLILPYVDSMESLCLSHTFVLTLKESSAHFTEETLFK